MAIENGYHVLDTTPIAGTTERRLMECNAKAMYVIKGGLIITCHTSITTLEPDITS